MWKKIIADSRAENLWVYLLREARSGHTLVLVNNLLMAREVRRKWQAQESQFAPDIRTLEDWIQEIALHSLNDDDIPDTVISPEDRSLWLEQWLLQHSNSDWRRFSGVGSITAISNIIGKLFRSNIRPGALLARLKATDDENSQSLNLAEVIAEYEKAVHALAWMNQEELPMGVQRISEDMIRHRKIVVYLVDEIDPLQEYFLELIAGQCKPDNCPEFVFIHMEEMDLASCIEEINRPGRTNSDISPTLFLQECHHPRLELEEAVRHMLCTIDEQGKEGNTVRGDGLTYDDFVILAGDLSHYEGLINDMSARFKIPLYTSRGLSLISHPFLRRFLTYLKLDHNGFSIDDVARVFSDNRLSLPDLEDYDEKKAPNIRHFSQFCRAWNFRTLDEASEGIHRVLDVLEQKTVYDDEKRELKRKEALQRDRTFYLEVIRHLMQLRLQYNVSEKQPLDEWIGWIRGLLRHQANLKSLEANEARQILEVILAKLETSSQRLHLTRYMSRSDFFRLLELRLKETRERVQQKPGGVLVTEISQLPEVHDKIVYVIGLHEEGFPKIEQTDFLQFRYGKVLNELTGKDGSEAFELGRKQFIRLLASSYPRFLSRPRYVAYKQVMPSPLWIDLVNDTEHAGLQEAIGKGWKRSLSSQKDIDKKDYPVLISELDEGLWSVQSMKSEKKNGGPKAKQENEWIRHFLHIDAVEKERSNPFAMGEYDGVLNTEVAKNWRSQWTKNQLALSISRLNLFSQAPLDYFFRYVLKLEPLHEYKEDADANVKGLLLHDILQAFYSETEEGKPIWPKDNPKEAKRRIETIRNRFFRHYEHQLGSPESPFPGLLKKQIEQVADWFLEVEQAGLENIKEELEPVLPAVFYPEYGFEMEQEWLFEEAVDDLKVLFRGKIDRIDLTKEGRSAVIYDYKAGSSGIHTFKKDIMSGKGFQLPVYGRYLQKRGMDQFLAGYYKLPVNGKMKDVERRFELGSAELIKEETLFKKNSDEKRTSHKSFLFSSEMDTFMEAIFRLRIHWIVRAIAHGHFHLSVNGQSQWSDYRFISRYNASVQNERKTRELSARIGKEMSFELDRYYLHEPFLEYDE